MLLKYNLLCLITSFISLANGEEDEIVLANFCYNATYQGECKRYLRDYDDDVYRALSISQSTLKSRDPELYSVVLVIKTTSIV